MIVPTLHVVIGPDRLAISGPILRFPHRVKNPCSLNILQGFLEPLPLAVLLDSTKNLGDLFCRNQGKCQGPGDNCTVVGINLVLSGES